MPEVWNNLRAGERLVMLTFFMLWFGSGLLGYIISSEPCGNTDEPDVGFMLFAAGAFTIGGFITFIVALVDRKLPS